MIALPFQKFQLGDCVINCNDMTVNHLEQSQSLPAKVFEFLKLLVINAQQTVTKEQAIELVWENNVEVGKRGISNAIWQLRKTWSELGLEPDDYFKTVPKVGYQLLVPVTPVNEISGAFVARHRRSNARIILAVIGLLILLWLMIFWKPGQPAVTKVVQKPVRITHYEGVEEQAAISPDGKRMAFLWQRERKPAQIYIKDLTDATAPLRQVSMSSFSEMSPAWSPDGQSLAYMRIQARAHCEIRIRDLISNRDSLVDKGCAGQGFRRNLAWSPNGGKLAYVKSSADKKSIFIHNLSTQENTPLAESEKEIQDVLIQWSSDSERILYVQEREMSAELAVHDLKTTITQVLPYTRDMIIGLAWDHQTNRVFTTALLEGSFVIESINLDDFNVAEFHRDRTISSLAVNQAERKLYYSNHIGQEFITVRDLDTGTIQSQVISSSRDLFGQYLAATDEILYVSNRNGSWELWSKKDGQNLMLTKARGLVSLPSVSPADGQFAVLVKPKGEKDYQLFWGDRQTDELIRLPEFAGRKIKYPSFTEDGTGIVFSAETAGRWRILRYNFADKTFTPLHQANARYTTQTSRGLYFSKVNQSGIYYYDFATQTERLLIAELSQSDWGNFYVENDAVFYVSRAKDRDFLKKRNIDGEVETLFELPAKSIRTGRALAKGKQGQVVVSMLGINDADIYKIDL